jgi:hypothetical protein
LTVVVMVPLSKVGLSDTASATMLPLRLRLVLFPASKLWALLLLLVARKRVTLASLPLTRSALCLFVKLPDR